MPIFGFYLVKKAWIGFDLICLYLFARLAGAVFGFDLDLVICLFIIHFFCFTFLPQARLFHQPALTGEHERAPQSEKGCT